MNPIEETACPTADMHAMCAPGLDRGAGIRDILARIGDKWSLLVMGMLDDGAQRFTVLHKSVPGISQRMLTLTLRHLERDGLVSRTVYAEVPPRVEYEVTELGRTLIQPVMALAVWANEHQSELRANRDAYDERALLLE
jgi:DNA-binding HxlR family transcriptional regulator